MIPTMAAACGSPPVPAFRKERPVGLFEQNSSAEEDEGDWCANISSESDWA